MSHRPGFSITHHHTDPILIPHPGHTARRAIPRESTPLEGCTHLQTAGVVPLEEPVEVRALGSVGLATGRGQRHGRTDDASTRRTVVQQRQHCTLCVGWDGNHHDEVEKDEKGKGGA
jgi:hypothetical protein